MKTSTDWFEQFGRFGGDLRDFALITEEQCKAIQNDAFKAGMLRACDVVAAHPLKKTYDSNTPQSDRDEEIIKAIESEASKL